MFRVVLAFATIFDLGDRARDLSVHYTDAGVMPRSLVLSDFWNSEWLSVYMISGTAWVTLSLFILNVIINCFMLVGYYTKTTTVLSYIFLVGLQARNCTKKKKKKNVKRVFGAHPSPDIRALAAQQQPVLLLTCAACCLPGHPVPTCIFTKRVFNVGTK